VTPPRRGVVHEMHALVARGGIFWSEGTGVDGGWEIPVELVAERVAERVTIAAVCEAAFLHRRTSKGGFLLGNEVKTCNPRAARNTVREASRGYLRGVNVNESSQRR